MTTQALFSPGEISVLGKGPVPKHVAIIPDGNRRWAKRERCMIKTGHYHGTKTIIETVKAAKELGIKIITFYLFSTENWIRPKTEVRALMYLLETFLQEQRPIMKQNGIRMHTIGELSRLSKSALKEIHETKETTANCTGIDMILALNYGSRDELCRAFHKILDDYAKQALKKNEITENTIAQYLDTAPWGDPDLLIRTSGEVRISNFLLWQLSYAEIYSCPVLWPDFTPKHLLEALINFQQRERRGGT